MKIELQTMLDTCSEELNDIDLIIEQLNAFDKSRSYLTNYALIRAAGTAESVYRSIVADYFSRHGDARIDRFLDSAIRRGASSVTYKNMKALLKKFDEQWSQDFEDHVKSRSDHEQLVGSSNSLVSNRHAFAHGQSLSTSFSDVKKYYLDVVKLIKILDKVVCCDIINNASLQNSQE